MVSHLFWKTKSWESVQKFRAGGGQHYIGQNFAFSLAEFTRVLLPTRPIFFGGRSPPCPYMQPLPLVQIPWSASIIYFKNKLFKNIFQIDRCELSLIFGILQRPKGSQGHGIRREERTRLRMAQPFDMVPQKWPESAEWWRHQSSTIIRVRQKEAVPTFGGRTQFFAVQQTTEWQSGLF